jgi:hypothetical protein
MPTPKVFEVNERVEGTSAKVLGKRGRVLSVDSSGKSKKYEIRWWNEPRSDWYTNRSLKKMANMEDVNVPVPLPEAAGPIQMDLSVDDDDREREEGGSDSESMNSIDQDEDNEVDPEDGIIDHIEVNQNP